MNDSQRLLVIIALVAVGVVLASLVLHWGGDCGGCRRILIFYERPNPRYGTLTDEVGIYSPYGTPPPLAVLLGIVVPLSLFAVAAFLAFAKPQFFSSLLVSVEKSIRSLASSQTSTGAASTDSTAIPTKKHKYKDASQTTAAVDRWAALVRYDPEISEAADKLRPFGDAWIAKLGQDYFALQEDRKYLPNMVQRLLDEAENQVAQDRARVEQEAAQRWARAFSQTANGERCTDQSLNILREAQAQGYELGVEMDRTIRVTKNGTTYLRSNDDIQRFGSLAKILPRTSE